MSSMTQAIRRLKSHYADLLPDSLIFATCRALGHPWRDRQLNPARTTHLFVQQVLHGNTAISHLRHLGGLAVSDSAYCQARQRLPVAFFRRLQQAATGRIVADPATAGRWRGHRTYVVDGSSFSMPDVPELQAAFGQPGGQAPGCGFPTAHLLARFDAMHGFLLQTVALPLRSHDLAGVPTLHAALQSGDLLVGDRAYASFAHLALCRQRRVHALFRAHPKQIVSFRPHRRHRRRTCHRPGSAGQPSSPWLRRLGRHDQLVEYTKPPERPDWLSAEAYAALPERLVVRELRYWIKVPGRRTRVVTLVTTLTDARRYSARALARLYGQRWQVEGHLRHLKTTLGMDVLHCQSFVGVLKELLMFVVVYNLVRRVMVQAARQQGVAVERVSFVDAWRWLRQARPGEAVPKLKVNPARPGRVEPRVRKRRPKEFPVMQRPRAQLRQAMYIQNDAA